MHTEQNDGPTAFPSTYRTGNLRLTIAIAGSRALRSAPETLFHFIAGLPVGSRILLRRGMKTKPGLFELTLARYITAFAPGVDYIWVLPDPTGGRESTYLRDVAMTRRADLVLCFFSDETMSGGTEHVVDKAIDALTPVYSWGFNGTTFVRIGEHDPDDIYAELVPKV